MIIKDNNFKDYKQKTLNKLNYALDNNFVDKPIIEILKNINSKDNFVTTSSCAGRIVIMEIPTVGDKKNAIFHGKWHNIVTLDKIKNVIKKFDKGQLWFLAQPPIFHIASENIYDADNLLKIGIKSGFKHSGFKTVKDRIIVEICSTERIDMPIGFDQKIYTDDVTMLFLIDLANNLIIRSQKKLKKFKNALSKNKKAN
jgi:tRNA wybutosine-synthesizing protein 3